MKNQIGYDYNTGDKAVVRRTMDYKYKIPFQGPYKIIQTWTNGTVTIKTVVVTSRLNIRRLKTYNNPEVYSDIDLQKILTYKCEIHNI